MGLRRRILTITRFVHTHCRNSFLAFADGLKFQDDSSPMPDPRDYQSIEIEFDDNDDEDDESDSNTDVSPDDSSGAYEDESENYENVKDTPPRDTAQHRRICGVQTAAPLFPRLPIRNNDEVENDEALSASAGEDQSKQGTGSRRRQRKPSPGINIEYTSRKGSGRFILEPPPLPIAYGWMVKGTKKHVEDLHLTGIPFCNREVRTDSKVDILGEYTWIQATPSQEKKGSSCPAIYVPGNCCFLSSQDQTKSNNIKMS